MVLFFTFFFSSVSTTIWLEGGDWDVQLVVQDERETWWKCGLSIHYRQRSSFAGFFFFLHGMAASFFQLLQVSR